MLLSKKTAQVLILVFKILYFKCTVVHKEMGKYRAKSIAEGGAVLHSVFIWIRNVFFK